MDMQVVTSKEFGMEEFEERYGSETREKLEGIPEEVAEFVLKWINHCRPETVFVKTDSEEDVEYVRRRAVELGEEKKLKREGHTVHFDGEKDQARDKENTKYLLSQDDELGESFNTKDREKGLEEMQEIMDGIMEGKEVFVGFFSLAPKDSDYSIPAVQITDSAYVMHSEDMLYRRGYDLFRKMGEGDEFFRFVHSAGELDENNNSKNVDKRRVYLDFPGKTVYSSNTQYGGNTLGLKKLAMRLAIKKCSGLEDWLTEHMFIMGTEVNGEKCYFTGAFPSGCGKTSTAMVEGGTLVGDDIAYLVVEDGEVRAFNPERGIFGIIRDVSEENDPVIWKALNEPKEAIFSNLLVKDGRPYWMGMEEEIPDKGYNFQGEWWKGKTDVNGKEIPPSHPNARYTLRIRDLDNMDEKLNHPEGVKVDGVIYGGRDSDTWVPVKEAFSWKHGILTMAACLESETTSATLGKSGVRNFNPASNLDFLCIPIGEYIQNKLDFGKTVDEVPKVFAVNYFLKDEDGRYLNAIEDKRVWLRWMALRSRGEVEALETPVGLIPRYGDLRRLFREILDKEYTEEEYEEQFALRIPEHLSKMERIKKIYREEVNGTPQVLYEELERQEERLKKWREEFENYISPEKFR
ncbi:MAG: phosphoenolpyruvate carboxykinase (GTP) [Candidatus Aenigmatarchaeota archaeon]